MSDIINELQKQTWNSTLERTGFFCSICGEEQQNSNGLVHFQSRETVNSLNVCHDCLPEDFE